MTGPLVYITKMQLICTKVYMIKLRNSKYPLLLKNLLYAKNVLILYFIFDVFVKKKLKKTPLFDEKRPVLQCKFKRSYRIGPDSTPVGRGGEGRAHEVEEPGDTHKEQHHEIQRDTRENESTLN